MTNYRRVAASLLTVALLGGAGCGGEAGVSAQAAEPPSISCTSFFRERLTEPPRAGEKITLSESGGDESVVVGNFRFRVLYLVESPEPPSVSVFVKTARGSDPITQDLYQLPEGGLGASFAGRHGFTGLTYVRHPQTRSELQYICTEK
ncbi:MAG: hypothetical protein M3198_04840 [Actinomycetota bacterium]|nr:hypothetical protein [Actinomycetota bacterium]